MMNGTTKLILVTLLLAPAAFSFSTPRHQSAGGIETMTWLKGCWQGEKGDRTFEETWIAPAAGAMLGVSRTIRGGKMTEYEFMQIKEQDGSLVYIAQPSGKAGDSFKSIRLAGGEAVFENPGREFPQRIIYRLTPDKSLFARIEGTDNGQNIGIDFPMKRVKCE
jgi:hypothetical protein